VTAGCLRGGLTVTLTSFFGRRWTKMDDTAPYSVTEAGVLAMRVTQLEAILRHLDRHSLDLLLYAKSVDGTPDRYEWSVVLDLIGEVRDAYGLRTPER
jgi:hypothetical protein